MNKQNPNSMMIIETEEEVALIRSTFYKNDELLKSMRALMFGLETSQEEKETIKNTFANEVILNIVSKRFYPTLDRNSAIGVSKDSWLGVEEMIFGMSKDTIKQAIEYKKIALEMTNKALILLENPDNENSLFELVYNPDEDDDLGIKLLARNQFIKHVEHQLLFLKQISEIKEETEEEKKERQEKNSSK